MSNESESYESTWTEEDTTNSVDRDNVIVDDREFFKNVINEQSEYEEFSTTTHNESTQRYESQFVEEEQSSNEIIDSRSQAQEAYWWASYKNSQGFKEALSQFDLKPELLDEDPITAINRSNNPNDPLYWLKRNIETYFDRENNRYFIPVTEYGGGDEIDPDSIISPEIRMAYDLHNYRTNYFSTDIFMELGDKIAITVDALDSPQTNCFAATGTSVSRAYRKANPMSLVEKQTVIYTADRSGPLMLACINKNRDMKSWGKKITITAVPKNETKKVPIFVFGLNSQKEWEENIIQTPNSLNQVMMMSGRDKIYISTDVAKKLLLDIDKLLSEYLLISTTYDKLNGFDSSKALHFPTQNLQVITFERCGFMSNSFVALCNNPKTRNVLRTEYVDWHELGHAHTMGWSWGTEIEVTVNIYEMVSEGLFKGKKDKFQGYDLSGRARFKLDDSKYGNDKLWDPKSVPNFINARVDSSVLEGGFDAMSSTSFDVRDRRNRKPAHVDNESIRLIMFLQLLFSYGDDFYAKLGKAYREAWNYGDGRDLFDTNQKDKDWFVLNASRVSGRDLREFFDLWGLVYSQDVRDAIGEMNLPSPLDDKVIDTDTSSEGSEGTNTETGTGGSGGSEGTITVAGAYGGGTYINYTRSEKTINFYEHDGNVIVYEAFERIRSDYNPSQGTTPGSGGTIAVDKRNGITIITYQRSGKTFTVSKDAQGTITVSEKPEGITTVYKGAGGNTTDTSSGGTAGTITVDEGYGRTDIAYTRSGKTIKLYEYSDGNIIVYESPEGIRSDYNPSQGTTPDSEGTITVDKSSGITTIVYKRSGKTFTVSKDAQGTITVSEKPEGITTVYKGAGGNTTDTSSRGTEGTNTETGTGGSGGTAGTIGVEKRDGGTYIDYTRSEKTIKFYEYPDGDVLVYEVSEEIRSDYKPSQGTTSDSGGTITVAKSSGRTNIVYKRSGKTFTVSEDSQGTIRVYEEPEGITTIYTHDGGV